MDDKKPYSQGHALSNEEIHTLIEEHDAEICYGMICCGARHVRTKKNVVLLVMGPDDATPVAYTPIACVHGIEAIVDRLRKAASEAFTGQPCTECEAVE